MQGFFQKIQILFEIVIYSLFSLLKISPWGQIQVLLGSKYSAAWGQNLMHRHKVSVCMDALNFDPWCTLF